MQVTIARQLGLDPSTVSNFFMNARRRSVDKWKDDRAEAAALAAAGGHPFDDSDMDGMDGMDMDMDGMDDPSTPPPSLSLTSTATSRGHYEQHHHPTHPQVSIKATPTNAVLVTNANPAAVVQHLQQPQEATLTPTAALDL